MATSTQKRRWWAAWRCDTSKMTRVAFPGDGRTWNLLVADESVGAWNIFVFLMQKHGYKFRESAGGTYNCRKISGTNSWSLHAYGIAVDLNPSVNSYGQSGHDFPAGFIRDVEATGLFRWGGRWNTPDPMHWEVDVPPSDIPQDQPQLGDPMLGFNVGQLGDPSVTGVEAETLQHLLLAHGEALPQYGADGYAGDETRKALASFQSKHNISESGQVGPRTYAAFHKPGAAVDLSGYAKTGHHHDGRYLKSVTGNK